MTNKPVTLSDEFMHKVAIRVGELIVEDLHNDPEASLEGYVPSKKHKSAMKDILKGRKPKGRVRTLKTTLVLAAVLVTLFVCAMSVTAVRKSVYKFFMSINGNHATVSYESDGASTALTEIETYYEPSYLPEGFVEIERRNLEAISRVPYSDGASRIYFTQTVFETSLVIDAENDLFTTIYMNDYECIYAVDKDNSNQVRILWNDEDYVYKIACTSPNINVNELISMAESIASVK